MDKRPDDHTLPADPSARFLWHPQARVFDAKAEVLPLHEGGGTIDDSQSGLALARALAQPGRGFRIGGTEAALCDHDCFETLTSGSSGGPRRIARTMQSWTASFAVNASLFDIGPGVKVAVLGRLVHSLALYGSLEAVHLGADLHLLDAMRPDRQRVALGARKVEVLYATPAQLRLLVEAGHVTLPDLRLVVVGGSKLDPALRAALANMTDATVREFYGAAEASFITLAGRETPQDSVGPAYPGVQISLRNVDAEGLGEIWMRSPYLFKCYAGGDPGSARCVDGWLSVGEVGWLDGGNLYLAGRAGRMVTVADQNVYPEEIEAFMAGLPGVRQVAVLPRPDALRGTSMVAVLLGEHTHESAILAACRQRLGPLKAPRRLIWRDEWPTLASGKTNLRRLIQEHLQ